MVKTIIIFQILQDWLNLVQNMGGRNIQKFPRNGILCSYLTRSLNRRYKNMNNTQVLIRILPLVFPPSLPDPFLPFVEGATLKERFLLFFGGRGLDQKIASKIFLPRRCC